MNITVYLGANPGNDPALREAVRALGRWIGESGNALVYGGSKSGLMGELAQSVLDAGGDVTGVEPQFFIDECLQCDGLTELIVTRDMSERKAKMIELGDAFIAFPGGTGTLEEITEVMSKVSLRHLDAPCILYNLNGYYDSLRALLQHMIEKGLSSEERQAGIWFARKGPQRHTRCGLLLYTGIGCAAAKRRPAFAGVFFHSRVCLIYFSELYISSVITYKTAISASSFPCKCAIPWSATEGE